MNLSWFIIPDGVPRELKNLIAQFAWGNTRTTKEDWAKAIAYYHEKTIQSYGPIMLCACKDGHFAIAQWIRAAGARNLNGAMSVACHGGHLVIAQWLCTEGASNMKMAATAAITELLIEIH